MRTPGATAPEPATIRHVSSISAAVSGASGWRVVTGASIAWVIVVSDPVGSAPRWEKRSSSDTLTAERRPSTQKGPAAAREATQIAFAF